MTLGIPTQARTSLPSGMTEPQDQPAQFFSLRPRWAIAKARDVPSWPHRVSLATDPRRWVNPHEVDQEERPMDPQYILSRLRFAFRRDPCSPSLSVTVKACRVKQERPDFPPCTKKIDHPMNMGAQGRRMLTPGSPLGQRICRLHPQLFSEQLRMRLATPPEGHEMHLGDSRGRPGNTNSWNGDSIEGQGQARLMFPDLLRNGSGDG